jgi:hypothetical protein
VVSGFCLWNFLCTVPGEEEGENSPPCEQEGVKGGEVAAGTGRDRDSRSLTEAETPVIMRGECFEL